VCARALCLSLYSAVRGALWLLLVLVLVLMAVLLLLMLLLS
jgi:hypothetical protein